MAPPSEWLTHIQFLYLMARAGYPFEKDDLTIEEWLDLGRFIDYVDSRRL